MPIMTKKYVSANLTPEAMALLRRTARLLAVQADRTVTQSDALIAVITVANRHPDELAQVIIGPPGEDSP